MINRCSMLLFVAAVFVVSQSSRGDLLLNGSFELPGFATPPDFRLLSDGDTFVTGWTVHNDAAGEAPYYARIGGGDPSFPYLGHDGSFSVYLNAGSSIETTFSAVAGVTYSLAFWSTTDGTRPLSEYGPLSVNAGATTTTTTAPNGLQYFIFTAAVTDPSAQLKFSNDSAPGDYKIYVLDTISVNPVPEPFSCVMSGIGGLYVVAHSRRRRIWPHNNPSVC